MESTVHYCVRKGIDLTVDPCQMNPLHILQYHFFHSHFDIILPSGSWSHSIRYAVTKWKIMYT